MQKTNWFLIINTTISFLIYYWRTPVYYTMYQHPDWSQYKGINGRDKLALKNSIFALRFKLCGKAINESWLGVQLQGKVKKLELVDERAHALSKINQDVDGPCLSAKYFYKKFKIKKKRIGCFDEFI